MNQDNRPTTEKEIAAPTGIALENLAPAESTVVVKSAAETQWENLNALACSLQETDYRKALELATKAGCALLDLEILVVYQSQKESPTFQRLVSQGPAQLLPDELPDQDLYLLKKPAVWRSGRRPNAMIHRQARTSGLAFLASAPIGQPGAIIGLAVAAGVQYPPSVNSSTAENLLPALEIYASTITSLLQYHSQVGLLHSAWSEGQPLVRLNTAVEEHMNEGILQLTPDLQIVRLNPAAEMILGFANREVVGQAVEKILIGSESITPALTAAQSGSATFNVGNLRLYRRNGEEFLALARIFPVMQSGDTSENGQVEKIILFLQDLSEQEQIRLQTQQLEQRAILGEVTAIFAHEVRNPINNISTGLQLLAMNLPPEDSNQASITSMQQDCDRLAELIRSVLAFSRPTDYEMEKLDLSVVLRRLLERLHPRITNLEVTYNLQVEENCPLVLGNFRALEQVFSNLINNALQAMSGKGGQLLLKVKPDSTPEGKPYVEVAIADTGPGIPKEIQERIFQPFFTTNSTGTGLGLAIVKRILTAHKGIIQLTSFPGGTVFYVQLPAIPTEPS